MNPLPGPLPIQADPPGATEAQANGCERRDRSRETFASALDRAQEGPDEARRKARASRPHATPEGIETALAMHLGSPTATSTAASTSPVDGTAVHPEPFDSAQGGLRGAAGAAESKGPTPTATAPQGDGARGGAARPRVKGQGPELPASDPAPTAGAPRQQNSRGAVVHGAPGTTGNASPRSAERPLPDAVAHAGRERLARAPERATKVPELKARAADAAHPAFVPPAAPNAPAAPDGFRVPAAPPAPSASAAALLHADPRADVGGAILPAAAHLRLSSDALGDVTLHLRMRDGAAHVRVEASATAAVDARAPELARALAAEGIALAKLEVEPRPPAAAPQPDGGPRADADRGGGHGRRERNPDDGTPVPTPTPPRRAQRPRRAGHDVTA
jgi:hypothetical protein